jgi:hypothetical protein
VRVLNGMTEHSAARNVPAKGSLNTIVTAWLVAGTMDLTAALTYYPLTAGVRPVRIVQGIASGVLGASAFQGGFKTAALGVVFHYLIALIWTVVFFVAAQRFKVLTKHVVPVGLTYGVVVWLVMNLIVLPLSNVRHAPIQLGAAVTGAVILMFCIGLPIAVIVGRRLS